MKDEALEETRHLPIPHWSGFALLVTFTMLLAVKLVGENDLLSWWWVCAPLFGWVALFVLSFIYAVRYPAEGKKD